MATLLACGLVVLTGADIVLASAGTRIAVFAGIALWGLHLGMTQGLLATMVADTAPPELRGSAFGLFNLLSGLTLLVASALAGLLWDWRGPAFTFLAGAAFCMLALLAVIRKRRLRRVVASAMSMLITMSESPEKSASIKPRAPHEESSSIGSLPYGVAIAIGTVFALIANT